MVHALWLLERIETICSFHSFEIVEIHRFSFRTFERNQLIIHFRIFRKVLLPLIHFIILSRKIKYLPSCFADLNQSLDDGLGSHIVAICQELISQQWQAVILFLGFDVRQSHRKQQLYAGACRELAQAQSNSFYLVEGAEGFFTAIRDEEWKALPCYGSE